MFMPSYWLGDGVFYTVPRKVQKKSTSFLKCDEVHIKHPPKKQNKTNTAY